MISCSLGDGSMRYSQTRGLTIDTLNSSGKSLRAVGGWLALALAAAFFGAQPARAVVHSSIVVDASTGRVLEASNADAQAHPASLTKLMTLYLTFERLQSGQWTLSHRLFVSEHAAAQQPTKLWLQPGTTVSVQSAILGITTRSANDAAVVLAENIAGTEWRFVQMMNAEARRLGMTRTIFYNASGLPNAQQWTTARDMSKLAIALIHTYPQYYHFFGVQNFRFRGHTVYGYDNLLSEYKGVDGMKTGYVSASGFNIVTSAVRDQRRLVGVVMGGRTARARDLQMIALLNRGFATPSPATTEEVASVKHEARPTAIREVPVRDVSLPAPQARVVPVREAQTRERAARIRLVNTTAAEALARHDWTIQIGGGFHSPYTVRRVLRSAALTEPLLHQGRQIVVKLRGPNYLARVADLSHETAVRACYALGRARFTCTILNHIPERARDIADASISGRPR